MVVIRGGQGEKAWAEERRQDSFILQGPLDHPTVTAPHSLPQLRPKPPSQQGTATSCYPYGARGQGLGTAAPGGTALRSQVWPLGKSFYVLEPSLPSPWKRPMGTTASSASGRGCAEDQMGELGRVRSLAGGAGQGDSHTGLHAKSRGRKGGGSQLWLDVRKPALLRGQHLAFSVLTCTGVIGFFITAHGGTSQRVKTQA